MHQSLLLAFDELDTGIIICDQNLKIKHINKVATKFSKVDPQFIERELSELDTVSMQGIRILDELNHSEKSSMSYEKVFTNPEDYVNEIHFSLHDEAGKSIGILSKLMKAVPESELREAAMLRTLMDNVPIEIYFKDRHGKFIAASTHKALTHGMTQGSELLNLSDFDLFDEDHALKAYQDEKKIMEGDQSMIREIEETTLASGETVWYEASKLPLKNFEGKIIGTYGISYNITERKKLDGRTEKDDHENIKLKHSENLQQPIQNLKSSLEKMFFLLKKRLGESDKSLYDEISQQINDIQKRITSLEESVSEGEVN